MRYFFKFFLLFVTCFCYSQQKNSEIKVDYKMYCDADVPLWFKTTLWIDNNVSIYKERASTTERWEGKSSEIEISSEKLKSDYEPYLKIDRNKKEVLYFDAIGKNIFIVKDNYTNLKWNITKETKQVAGYTCTKATTNFRGREWIAWFTPEIPVSLGPWKLHGLPGIILETSDSTKKFTIIAEKIEFTKTDIFDKDFATLMNVRSKKPIPIQKFMQDGQEARDNADKTLMGNKDFTLEIIKEPRKGEELIYEWEQ